MNPLLPERRYELADLEPVLVAAQSQFDAVLVGGQAVYFWADQYRARCPALNEYLPFTSKDADYLANIPAAEQLARTLHSRFQLASRKGGMMGLCLGYIPLAGGLQLEILGRIHGVKTETVHGTAVRMGWRDKTVNVIHPMQLFIAKGRNLSQLDQTERQDGKHFAIMQWVLRTFLTDLANSREPEAPEALLTCCESIIWFALDRVGLKLIADGHMPPPVFWPSLTEHPSERSATSMVCAYRDGSSN